MSQLPAGTVTFLFTDIEGSTRLVAALRDRYVDALKAHERVLTAAATENGGRLIDTQGDAFFFAFPRAIDAARAAIAGQRGLEAHDWPQGERLRVRMGLHTGEPIVGDDRYVGVGVHRAARISAAGHGGQILLSSVTRHLIEDDLPEGIEIRDLGEHQLKDMKRPERLYQVVADGLQADFPPLRSAEAIPPSPFEDKARYVSGRRRRVALAVAAIAIMVLGVGGAVLALGGWPPAGIAPAPPNTVAVVDSDRAVLTRAIEAGENPGPIAIGDGFVWVANRQGQTLTRIDIETYEVTTFGLGFTPASAAAGHGSVWLAEAARGRVVRLNAFTGREVRSYNIGIGGIGQVHLAVGADAVWAADGSGPQVVRIDPASNQATPIPLDNLAQDVAVDSDWGVWVVEGTDALARVDPTRNTVSARIPLHFESGGLALGAGIAWLTDPDEHAVWRFDLQTRVARPSVSVGQVPGPVAFGADAAWVANTWDGTVSKIDPSRGIVLSTLEVGQAPAGLAVSADRVWVTIGRP